LTEEWKCKHGDEDEKDFTTFTVLSHNKLKVMVFASCFNFECLIIFCATPDSVKLQTNKPVFYMLHHN